LVFTNFFGEDIKNASVTYLVFLPIIWAALRFGQREVVLTVLFFSTIAVWGVVQSVGAFSNGVLSQSLISLQSYMIVVSVTSMILGSVIEERKILEKRKDDFISVASHELKTPVTSIKGYAELLGLRLVKTNDSKSSDLVQKMDIQINKLINLINDLLDVSKIESGRLQLQNTYLDLNGLLDEIVEEMQMTTNKHKLIKKFDKTKILYADRERLEQVVVNIISNAIKYSPKKGKIVVKTVTDSRLATVSVQDFGIGIAKESQQKIFERFYQAENTAHVAIPSIGLGLYIAAEIVRRFGGKMWVKSRKGKGSTFYFSLPVSKTAK
jgi:signal transduction histidine kinase